MSCPSTKILLIPIKQTVCLLPLMHTGSLPYDLYIVQIIFLLMFLLLEGNYFKHIAKHTHTQNSINDPCIP